MKGFGSFDKPTGSNNSIPSQRADKVDLSNQKTELIYVLKRSQQLWNDDKCQEGLVLFRKAISILEFIVENESIPYVKSQYENSLKELKGRLKYRQEGRQVAPEIGGGRQGGQGSGGKGSKYDNNLKGQISDAIVTKMPNVKWEDVSGLENAKNKLKEAVILPIKFKEIFTGNLKPWKGILLYGPPGTGKTLLAKACANEAEIAAGITFFSVSFSGLINKYVGESEKLIKSLFNMAREKQPSIIFIDEIDSMLCDNRSDGENEASRRAKIEFLTQMQGFGHDDKGVQVLGATNLPWALDSPIIKRFQRRIYISLPEYETRLGMLKQGMRDILHELTQQNFQQLAKYCENYSSSDIAKLVRDAVYEPVRRLQLAKFFKKTQSGKWTPCREGQQGEAKSWLNFKDQSELDIGNVDCRDFKPALKRIKPSIDAAQLKKYEDWRKKFGDD